MSALQKSLLDFRSDVSSTSAKLQKRTLAAPAVSAPSPAPSTGSDHSRQNDILKRKREIVPAPGDAWSQPVDTGKGHEIMTQVQYALTHLKDKETPLKLYDILSYLSLQGTQDETKRRLAKILKQHSRVTFTPDREHSDLWGAGTYAYRPIYQIYNATQLLSYLQQQTSSNGLLVKELKDGWPSIEDTIDQLESEHKLLVVRNRKDEHARSVWLDDPSLNQEIDTEYKTMWHKIAIPPITDIVQDLIKLKVKPASADPSTIVKGPTKLEKKTKKPRKGGRTTNTHMAAILKDYSHLKR
jgi:transcription initiation factor TFIIE subunit beta